VSGRFLREFAESVESQSVAIRIEAAGCAAVVGILPVADTWPADMIVMGTHGLHVFELLPHWTSAGVRFSSL
jgi:nucleotide-binding universal stress UspA family protein